MRIRGKERRISVVRMNLRWGSWRSHLGDTWPHQGIEVELDYWPQSVCLVRPERGFFLCATGEGGGSQQAMFRSALEPLLADAMHRWVQSPPAVPRKIEAEIDACFGEIQRGFTLLQEPPWHDQFQASAVGLVVNGSTMAIAHTGVQRLFRICGQSIERLTADQTLASQIENAASRIKDAPMAELLSHMPAAFFGTWGEAKWAVRSGDVRPGDVFLLAAGLAGAEIQDQLLRNAITKLPELSSPSTNLMDAARTLGESLLNPETWGMPRTSEQGAKMHWYVASRVALIFVRIDGA